VVGGKVVALVLTASGEVVMMAVPDAPAVAEADSDSPGAEPPPTEVATDEEPLDVSSSEAPAEEVGDG
jgi:hypothetical protein